MCSNVTSRAEQSRRAVLCINSLKRSKEHDGAEWNSDERVDTESTAAHILNDLENLLAGIIDIRGFK